MQLHQTMCCTIFRSVGQWMMAWPTPDRGPSARLGWVAQCSLAQCPALLQTSADWLLLSSMQCVTFLSPSPVQQQLHFLPQSENISVLVNFASVLVFFIISINLVFWVFMCFQATAIVIVTLWAVSCARSPRLIWMKGH